MQKNNSGNSDTRSRLLQAAGEIFAKKGYRGATVRQISEQARANIAAIRYYFGGKEGLYSAVLHQTFIAANRKYPPDHNLPVDADPASRLHAFITSFLFRILDDGRPAWHGKLIVREIADPTPVLDQIVEEMIRPLYDHLTAIVRDLVADGATDEESVRLCAMSVMGQCLFYRNSRHVVSRLYKKQYCPTDIALFADHIAAFSLRALKVVSTSGGCQNHENN